MCKHAGGMRGLLSMMRLPKSSAVPRAWEPCTKATSVRELPTHFDFDLGLHSSHTTASPPAPYRAALSSYQRDILNPPNSRSPPAAMPDVVDPRMMKVQPRLRYNTIGGVNGPLVILESVRSLRRPPQRSRKLTADATGQIPQIQRDCVFDAPRWHRAVWPGPRSSR